MVNVCSSSSRTKMLHSVSDRGMMCMNSHHAHAWFCTVQLRWHVVSLNVDCFQVIMLCNTDGAVIIRSKVQSSHRR